MPKSSFYYHRTMLGDKDKYADLKQRITALYHKHKGRYGYRRMTVALKQLGVHHNHKLIAKLMKQLTLSAKIRRQKYRSYKGQQGKIAKNYLKRRFKASKPHKRWLTDITEFKVGDHKLYLSPILDCYNNEIVSYTLSRRPTYDLVSQMLDKALDKTGKHRHKTLMLHSDQGWHYQMKPFREMLKKHQIKQSMSRKGNCLDNALMEGFFGTLKCETIYIEKPKTIEALERQIHEYIHYYNHERIQLKLKGLSPVQYRTQSLK
ncbi:probable transposase IS3/IS150/IS904 family [Psychrobacter arcticus 273-4]|uniref:Probable transposase IS3/IS150/IS904 family n=2 Tax=Psychrobacter arcticus TaxID=334543 RepID=Q4FVS8_PSYA2|nr:probable transposase IS3/IS150/IS904 family [Psychrobacter arcticus 273-4]